MKKLFLLLALMTCQLSVFCKTVISGNYDGQFVGIFNYMDRDPSKIIRVPVIDGKFRYEMPSDTLLVYSIQSDKNLSSHMINYFFSEPAEITVIFTPNIDKFTGEDSGFIAEVHADEGTLTNHLNKLNQEIYDKIANEPCCRTRDSLEAVGKFYSEDFAKLMRHINADPKNRNDSVLAIRNNYYRNGTYLTAEGKQAAERLLQWFDSGMLQKIENNCIAADTTLAGLFLVAKGAKFTTNTFEFADIYEKHFKGRFPGHPYDQYMSFIASTYSPEVGKPFIDFEAPDFNGTRYRLSDLVKGKPAYLDLWSSQCISCRKKSISMKKVYDKYSPKGFTVVGVAREFGTPDAGKAAIEKDGYKWLNLLELDDANRIYDRYRCGMGLGMTVLIDDKGIIVAIDPSADEVEAWLDSYYAR